MKRDEPQNLDLLSAEYVLGTLVGAARRSFERRRGRDPFVDRRVRAWEERLAALSLRLAPVVPSPGVWAAVERRTRPALRGGWRAVAAAFAAAAVLVLGWFVWQETRPPQATAVLASEAGATLWHLELAADGDHVEVETVGDVRHPSGRSLELWALPPDAAPVSLGLMPAAGRVRLALDDRQRAALAEAPNVAVSDEPKGGSPTGAPTGAVLYVAPVART
jgi:anti-sigma-K factor RskA